MSDQQVHNDHMPFVVSTIHRSVSGVNGEVQHTVALADNIGSLMLNEETSDIILIVEDGRFPAHRAVLAARSEYFRALLFGGMRETEAKEIELLDCPVAAFRLLLRYIYSGKLSLSTFKEDLVLDLLGLSNKFGFSDLENSISDYLKAILNGQNVCAILGVSNLYSLRSLTNVCLNFGDCHALDVLKTQGFFSLSAASVCLFIKRDSFCAPEIEIFKAVREWVMQHPDQEYDELITALRLPLIKLEDLLNLVRPSGLLPPDTILDAIKERNEKRSSDLPYRGFLGSRVNVATTNYKAQVIAGEMPHALLDGNNHSYDHERGFTRHAIDDRNKGIIVELGQPFIINTVRLLLWDREPRCYSYYVEVSMEGSDWVRVVDHSRYLCRTWQNLHFPVRVVKYIRVVGTHNTANRIFHLVSLEAMHIPEAFEIDPYYGLLVPTHNVASVTHGATVIEGVSRSRNCLLNGETANYDWDNGYTCHQLGSTSIVIQLAQPYMIDSMRLLLWDCDERYYSYYIEVSCDQVNWRRIVDKTQEECRAWQILRFERQPMVFIRIVGTHNSANEVFHCVHFECPAQVLIPDVAVFDEVVPVRALIEGLAIIENGDDPMVVHIQPD